MRYRLRFKLLCSNTNQNDCIKKVPLIELEGLKVIYAVLANKIFFVRLRIESQRRQHLLPFLHRR